MLTEQNGIQVDKFEAPTDWQYSFPEGYTRLEYLESQNGQQFINTNYFLQSNNLKIKSKFTFNFSGSAERDLLGNQDNTTNRFVVGTYEHYLFAYSRDASGSESNIKTSTFSGWQTINLEVNYDWDNQSKSMIVNGTTITGSFVKNISPSTNPIQLLNSGTAQSTTSSSFNGKIYYIQIFDNNILKLNFIPVKRNSDNKPGMLDLVNNVFYVNQGTGEFVMGPELYSNNSQIDIRQKNNTNFVEKYKFNANNELVWANPQLNLSGPVGYTKVGSPTITDNVVSGFSYNNRLNITSNVANANITEMVWKFKLDSSGLKNNYNYVFYKTGGNLQISIYGNSTSQTFNAPYIYLPGHNQSYLFTNFIPSYDVWYWVKYTYDGTTVRLYSSTDGTNYTLRNTIENVTITGTNGVYQVGWGSSQDPTSIQYFSGSIDLKETYIKVNDKLWFYGKNYTSQNYAPVPAGLNYNNTTTPSIGYVNTQTQVFTPAPTDGIKYSQTRDLKVIPPEDNTITLLYGVHSSKYKLFGLLAQVSSGSYDVYIDDVLYGTYTSNTQCDIDFSENGANALGPEYVPIGTATTPEALTLHKIVIKPNTSGATITQFQCRRTTGASGNQQQGVLWVHFELDNAITLYYFSYTYNVYINNILQSITAKNNTLFIKDINYVFNYISNLIYIPKIDMSKRISDTNYLLIGNTKIKRLILDNNNTSQYGFNNLIQNCSEIEQITGKNSNYALSNSTFNNNYKLKEIKNNQAVSSSSTISSTTNLSNLYPTKIDLSNANNRTQVLLNGSSTYPMRGLRGLKVSNEAPFSGTSPQINVSYTGLDRDALVELFNSLPDVSEATDGITRQINITAATGNNLTKVGTPTIDENGVASGFSSGDYFDTGVTLNPYNQKTKIKVKTKITTGSTSVTGGIIGSGTYGNSSLGIFITSTRKLTAMIYYLGSTNKNLQCNSSITCELNSTYYAIAEFDLETGKFSISVSTDNINWTTNTKQPSDFVSFPNYSITYRIGRTQSGVFNGSIDLENTYIKVGQNYLMRGYLTDNDRLIATGKGWTITG